MKKLAFIMTLLLFAGCAHYYSVSAFHARDYQFAKNTLYIKVYWNLTRQDKDTVTAKGFVEPFNPDNGLQAVQLSLVGLDGQGKIVNSAEGMPRDEIIESPFYPASPFSITMKLNGQEKSFTIIGSYFHYGIGRKPPLDAAHIDYIPITSDDDRP
jgi:hypothetical protein